MNGVQAILWYSEADEPNLMLLSKEDKENKSQDNIILVATDNESVI